MENKITAPLLETKDLKKYFFTSGGLFFMPKKGSEGRRRHRFNHLFR